MLARGLSLLTRLALALLLVLTTANLPCGWACAAPVTESAPDEDEDGDLEGEMVAPTTARAETHPRQRRCPLSQARSAGSVPRRAPHTSVPHASRSADPLGARLRC